MEYLIALLVSNSTDALQLDNLVDRVNFLTGLTISLFAIIVGILVTLLTVVLRRRAEPGVKSLEDLPPQQQAAYAVWWLLNTPKDMKDYVKVEVTSFLERLSKKGDDEK